MECPRVQIINYLSRDAVLDQCLRSLSLAAVCQLVSLSISLLFVRPSSIIGLGRYPDEMSRLDLELAPRNGGIARMGNLCT